MKKHVKAKITEKASDGSFTAIASTAKTDRHNEVVDPSGWDLKNFKQNPVLLWAHDHTIPAIGNATKVWISEGKLMFKGVLNDATDFARGIKRLVDDGVLKTFSVGFMPVDMDGNTYTKQELLEISLVNVPANPDAQMLAYKSLKEEGLEDKVIKEFGVSVEVVDKLVTMEKDIKELQDKINSKAKEQIPSASQAPKQPIRTRQSLVKAIARSSDQILAGKKRLSDEQVKSLKIIKRAAEILSQSHKGELK